MIRLILVVLSALFVIGCAEGDKSSDKRPQVNNYSDDRLVTPDLPERECAAVLACAQKCAEWYPFRTEREIINGWGCIACGSLTKELERNRALMEQYYICLSLPESEVRREY